MNERELKKQLNDFQLNSRVVEMKQKELDKLLKSRNELISPQSSKFSLTPKSKGISDPTYINFLNIDANFDAMINKLKEEIKTLKLECKEVERAINELPSIYRMVIKSHYMDHKRWEIVATDFNYSDRQIFYIRKAAFETMLMLINNSLNAA
ncbi:MAG: hypothetical protein RR436_02900 [Clostridia bacterium]